jgi:hypothetical protein
MHNYGVKRCESKVERLRATHMLANHLSIAISAMSVKRESIFSKSSRSTQASAHGRETAHHASVSACLISVLAHPSYGTAVPARGNS